MNAARPIAAPPARWWKKRWFSGVFLLVRGGPGPHAADAISRTLVVNAVNREGQWRGLEARTDFFAIAVAGGGLTSTMPDIGEIG